MQKRSSGLKLPFSVKKKEQNLRKRLESFHRVAVAFSGGVDSTFLLFKTREVLGPERIIAVTAISEVFPSHEKKRAVALCKRFKIQHHLLRTYPLKNRNFKKNNPERCYHCKYHFFSRLIALAQRKGFPIVLEGSQKDDQGDYRPGARAKAELGILSPLLDVGMTKSDLRKLSRYHGLSTAELPAAACLASRVPYGTTITEKLLTRIAQAEESLRSLGFHQFRLRHHDGLARLEFDPKEMDRAYRYRRSITKRIIALGWTYVALDLRGYRQGSLNETLENDSSQRKPARG